MLYSNFWWQSTVIHAQPSKSNKFNIIPLSTRITVLVFAARYVNIYWIGHVRGQIQSCLRMNDTLLCLYTRFTVQLFESALTRIPKIAIVRAPNWGWGGVLEIGRQPIREESMQHVKSSIRAHPSLHIRPCLRPRRKQIKITVLSSVLCCFSRARTILGTLWWASVQYTRKMTYVSDYDRVWVCLLLI